MHNLDNKLVTKLLSALISMHKDLQRGCNKPKLLNRNSDESCIYYMTTAQ